MSFNKISEEIGISKPTLIKWNQEFSKEISNQRFLFLEGILEEYQFIKATGIASYGKLLNKALEALEKQDFQDLSIKDLMQIITCSEAKIAEESKCIKYTTDEAPPL